MLAPLDFEVKYGIFENQEKLVCGTITSNEDVIWVS
jgi:hypothetical protein